MKSDPGVLYFHLSPEECFFAAGFHAPAPPELMRLRTAAARAPKALKQMTAKLARTGLALSKEGALTRRPPGFEGVDDPDIDHAARLRRFVCLRPAPEARLYEPSLVDDFCAFAADSLPLLEWGWDALVDSR